MPRQRNVLDALRGYRWHAQAACADKDPELWFVAGTSGDKEAMGSPAALMANLICVSCPVRRECLGEALSTWEVEMGPGDVIPVPRIRIRATGTWGATTEGDRDGVRGLPVDQAIDRLESELPERIFQRVVAFEQRHPERPHRACGGESCATTRDMLQALRHASTPISAL